MNKKKAINNPHKAEYLGKSTSDRHKSLELATVGPVLPSVVPNIASIALEQYSYDSQVKEINHLIQVIENLIKKNIKFSKIEGKDNAREKNISKLLQLIRRIEKIE